MNRLLRIKITIDFIMTAVLLALMVFQITGQELHEWLGAAMIVLFLVHNMLNIKWYKNLFRGKYTAMRVLQTIVNLMIFASMICLAYSGITMSRYALTFIPIDGGMALARQMHMVVSYWGFVLMSVHAGLHYSMILGMARKVAKNRKTPNVISWILRIIAIGVAIYGAVCFYQAGLFSYMTLNMQFAFFDFEQSAVSVIIQYAAMMELWICIGYYVSKGIRQLSTSNKKENDV